MSVIEWDTIGAGREGEKNSLSVRTYTRIFRAVTNASTDDADTVLAYSEVPVPAVDVYPGDTSAFCISSSARQEVEDDHKCWLVTSKYSTFPPQTPSQFDPNPLLEPPVFSLAGDQYTTVARLAVDYYTGEIDRIRNTRGEILRPGIEVDESRGVYIVRKNLSYVDGAMVGFMTNTVNASPWKGNPPRTVKCKQITAGEVQTRNSIDFYPHVFEFHINPDTWDLRPLNLANSYVKNGRVYKLSPGDEPIVVYTGNGSGTINEKVPQLTVAAVDDIYLRKRYYREVNFSSYFPF